MLVRALKIFLGLAITAVGVAMLVLPGPGLLVTALGVGLVLAQSEPGRRVMSRVRLWARDRFGSEKVRGVERRIPRDVIGEQNTHEMRLDLEEYARRRNKQKRKRDR